MNRRSFIGTVTAGLLAVPFAVEAQQAGRVPRVGVLWHAGSADEEGRITRDFLKGFETSGTSMGATSSSNIAFPMKCRSDFGA
jgi:putative ABC transport system substrate-binding protein